MRVWGCQTRTREPADPTKTCRPHMSLPHTAHTIHHTPRMHAQHSTHHTQTPRTHQSPHRLTGTQHTPRTHRRTHPARTHASSTPHARTHPARTRQAAAASGKGRAPADLARRRRGRGEHRRIRLDARVSTAPWPASTAPWPSSTAPWPASSSTASTSTQAPCSPRVAAPRRPAPPHGLVLDAPRRPPPSTTDRRLWSQLPRPPPPVTDLSTATALQLPAPPMCSSRVAGYPSGPQTRPGRGSGGFPDPTALSGRVTGLRKRGGCRYGGAGPGPEPGGCHAYSGGLDNTK